jgi:hypothetical protein
MFCNSPDAFCVLFSERFLFSCFCELVWREAKIHVEGLAGLTKNGNQWLAFFLTYGGKLFSLLFN